MVRKKAQPKKKTTKAKSKAQAKKKAQPKKKTTKAKAKKKKAQPKKKSTKAKAKKSPAKKAQRRPASDNYAIIAAGGRQYTVAEGDVIRVDRLGKTAGDKISFDRVLLVGSGKSLTVGSPTVSGAKVVGQVIEEGRDRKVIVFKRKRRKQFRQTRGHRQWYTAIRIDSISAG